MPKTKKISKKLIELESKPFTVERGVCVFEVADLGGGWFKSMITAEGDSVAVLLGPEDAKRLLKWLEVNLAKK